MAEREYKDQEGNVVSLLTLVKREPEWAANIIAWYDKKLEAALAESDWQETNVRLCSGSCRQPAPELREWRLGIRRE